MTAETSFERSAAFLDEATENLTFDEFEWAFEEVWHGVGWALNALAVHPRDTLELGDKGALPRAGSLRPLLDAIPHPPRSARVAERLETALRKANGTPKPGVVEKLVMEAWALHNDCGLRLRVADDRLDAGKLMLAEVSPGRVGSPVVERRTALKLLAVGGMLPLQACSKIEKDNRTTATAKPPTSANEGASAKPRTPAKVASVDAIRGMHWPTTDPFLFCAHHHDAYPQGNEAMGPVASLEGRHIGRDFEGKDGWNMYHGRVVPGFPRHPHRGFETVTVVRTGLLDHSDSMGATARYGEGDVQWLTAGGGIQHAEMFPLLKSESPNPLELFQIWLNLPRADKMVPPHFTMLWNEKIPRVSHEDAKGRITQLTLAAGRYGEDAPPSPPPNSWASKPESDLAIWTIRMEAGALFELPAVNDGTVRSLYLHRGTRAKVGETSLSGYSRALIQDAGPIGLEAGPEEVEFLLLQARPIGEPVAKRGPFVMNTQDEIRQAYQDYRKTQFGGWPWGDNGPVHVRTKGRFAKLIDGSFEEPT